MRHTHLTFFCLAAAAGLLLLGQICAAPKAEAARFGRGSSFGGKSWYQHSAPAPRPAAPQGQRLNQEQRAAPAQNMGQNMGQPAIRPTGGLLGGLLAGSLLGALIFGDHSAGAGIADIMLLALAAFIGLKIFQAMRRKTAAADVGLSGAPPPSYARDNSADNAWEALHGAPLPVSSSVAPQAPPLPDSFNTEEFLKGAKMLYARLQRSWDARDLDDIAQFTTPDVLREITGQAQADPGPSRTDLLLVTAELISVSRENGEETASVYFDVLMREDPREQVSTQVREIWHFARDARGSGSWKLDGIQQVQ